MPAAAARPAPPIAPLPEIVPLFPLPGALLLPDGELPLRLFEPRYLAMFHDCLAAGRLIGMVQPDPQAARTPFGPGLYAVGCLGRVSQFTEAAGDTVLVTLTGVARFAIAEEIATVTPYRRAQVIYHRETAPGRLGDGRAPLLASVRAYFVARGIDADWAAIEALDDPALVRTLCMALPFEPVEKQALLQAADPADLLATLRALLEMGAGRGGSRQH